MVVVVGGRDQHSNHGNDAQNREERAQIVANVEVKYARRVLLPHALDPAGGERERH